MKILSIDVGMKNMAYCLLDYKDDGVYTIVDWDIIDLCENTQHICMGKQKNGNKCKKIGKYTKKNKFYCKTHAKEYKVPPRQFSNKRIKKLKKTQLVKIGNEQCIPVNEKQKKEDILRNIIFDLSNNYYDFVSNVLTTEMNMVSYGINLKKLFNNGRHIGRPIIEEETGEQLESGAVSVMISAQKLTQLPPYLRHQLTHLAIFDPRNTKTELQTLYDEFFSCEKDIFNRLIK